ncbi:hypothetical protein OAO87_02175 [bacterium]|nr:hypothetical protein [bacterium]
MPLPAATCRCSRLTAAASDAPATSHWSSRHHHWRLDQYDWTSATGPVRPQHELLAAAGGCLLTAARPLLAAGRWPLWSVALVQSPSAGDCTSTTGPERLDQRDRNPLAASAGRRWPLATGCRAVAAGHWSLAAAVHVALVQSPAAGDCTRATGPARPPVGRVTACLSLLAASRSPLIAGRCGRR